MASVRLPYDTDRLGSALRQLVRGFALAVATPMMAFHELFENADFSHVSIDAIANSRRVGQNFTLDHLFARGLWPVESGVLRNLDVSDPCPSG